MVILRKKQGMSTDEFREHWLEKHGPIFKKFPEIKSYTQFHVADRCRDDSDVPIDGIAVLEFESREALTEAFSRSEYQLIREDELQFLGPNGQGVHVVHVDTENRII